MDHAAGDVERLARSQDPVLAVNSRVKLALEHLEVLVLGGVVVRGRHVAVRAVGGYDFEPAGVAAADRDRLGRGELESGGVHA
jgi:hypothetical protein